MKKNSSKIQRLRNDDLQEAISGEEIEKQLERIKNEINLMDKNKTWEIVGDRKTKEERFQVTNRFSDKRKTGHLKHGWQ